MARKKLQAKGSSRSVEMSASHNLSEWADQNWAGQDTVSFKFIMKVIGMKEGDGTVAFVKAALNTLFNGISGSFSFKLPLSFAAENEERLIKVMEKWHKEADWILSLIYSTLTEEEKAVGKKIAKQNALRTFLLDLCKARADAEEYVSAFMENNGLLYVPRGIQLESTIVSGTRMFTDPGVPGFKEGYDEMLDEPVWKKNGEIYGRKRVPLKDEEKIMQAFTAIADMAESWEGYWSGATYGSAEEILDHVERWTATLKHGDHEVIVNKLTEQELKEAKREAAQYKLKM